MSIHCVGLVLLAVLCAPAWAQETLDRGMVAIRTSAGVHVGWRMLAADPKDIGFHVYRQSGNAEPILIDRLPRNATSLIDTPKADEAIRYAVRPVINGQEGPASPAVAVTDAPPDEPYLRIQFDGKDAAQKVGIGDLDGDGRYDFVIKKPDFNVDPYSAPGYWKKSQDTYKLEAYSADGQFLWRFDLGWSIEEGVWYSPYVVYDLDGDGKAEVYAKAGDGDPRNADGRVTSGPEYLVKIDGLTGQVTQKLPWPDRSGFESYNYYCRNILGIAYLDGQRPHLIVQRGTYTQIKIEAYDSRLQPIWRWNSRDEKQKYNSQGMHGLHAADVDGDGRDELVIGAAVLDDTGHGLWTRQTGHPDACYVGDIDPHRPGLEIFYGIEPKQKRDAVCLVEAKTGRTLWGCDEPSTHVHGQGMVADLTAEHPGQECYAGEKDGSRHWLYAAGGKRIGDQRIGGLAPRPFWWDGDPQKELYLSGHILDYDGKRHGPMHGSIIAIADILGDWREEVITSLPGELRIYTTTLPAESRRPCLMQDRLYRTDVAAVSMGYFSPPQLSTPLTD